MTLKKLKRYYKNARFILFASFIIVLPLYSVITDETVLADSSHSAVDDSAISDMSSTNITAPCFSFPLNKEWTISLDFGAQTDSGSSLSEIVPLEENTPVYAAANGTIKYTGYMDYYGITVIIEHFTGNEFVCSLYGNLVSEPQVYIEQPVTEGQLLGFISEIKKDKQEKPDAPCLYFGIRKGAYENINMFPAYAPPGDITEWYDPSEFIELHTYPGDKVLVNPSDGPYQDRLYWLQNQKLYYVIDKINDPPYPDLLEEMSLLPGWAEDTIINSSSYCLSLFDGWPDGIATFISTESGSNGLLISEYESNDIYLIINNKKLYIPGNTLIEYQGYDSNDVITVTGNIIGYFDSLSDNAELLSKAGDIEAFPEQPFTFSIAMLNSGTSIWSNQLQYGLVVLSEIDPFPNLMQYDKVIPCTGDNVYPGNIGHFNSNEIIAPSLPGIYEITCRMKRGTNYLFGDTVSFNIVVKQANNPPGTPLQPSGPSTGIINTVYTYQTISTDIENNQVKYIVDWGDSFITETEFLNSNGFVEQSHIWHNPGTYQIRVKAIDSFWNSSDWSIPALITINAPFNSPPVVPLPASGPLTGCTDTPYTYITVATDPDENKVKFVFDWNDDTTTETGYVGSGTTANAIHSWKSPGTYTVKVMAMDSQSAISNWSTNITVTIYSRPSTPATPEGQDAGFIDTIYEYFTAASDKQGENIKYIFDWGDNTTTETDYILPGTPVTESHTWNTAGIYDIKVQAITINASSGWSEPKQVTIISSTSHSPTTPVLQSPSNNGIVTGTSITFEWSESINATRYVLEVNSSESLDADSRIYYVHLNSNSIILNDFPNNGTTYYWRVRAGNAHTWSLWSSPSTFINIEKPSIPAIISPELNEVIAAHAVTFTWDEVEGADRYLIEVNTNSSWNAHTRKLYKIVEHATEYEDTGYTPNNTTYYWRIRAGNESEWSAWSTNSRFTVAAPLLTSPENAIQVSGNFILFEWTRVADTTKYLLEVNSDPEWDPYTCIFHDSVGNVAGYEVSGFKQDGTVYYWRVRCGNEAGWTTTSETRSFTNIRVQVPSSPTITSPEDTTTVNGNSVTYKWGAINDANKYLIEINTDPDWDSRKWKLLKDVGNITEYTDDGYSNDGTYYYWRVRAGNETGWSVPSESFSFKNFSLSAPLLIEPADDTTLSGKSTLFKWKTVANAQSYFFEVNSDESFNPKDRLFYKVVGKVTSQKVADLANDGTVYYWRVKASNGTHWSAWAEPFSFTSGLAGSLTASTLTAPVDKASVSGNTVIYKWSAVPRANQYLLEVNTDGVTWSRKTRKFFGNVGNIAEYRDTGYSNDGTVYYWRVRSGNDVNWSTFSTVWSFTNW